MHADHKAGKAIDGDLKTKAGTNLEQFPWLKVYFGKLLKPLHYTNDLDFFK